MGWAKHLLHLLVVACCLVACSGTAATPTSAPPAPTTVPATSTVAPASQAATASPVAVESATAPAAATVGGSARPSTASSATPVASSAAPRASGTPNVPNTTPAAAEALIEQAIDLLLSQYVDPLDSATLYRTAYQAAVQALTAFGKTPQAQTLVLDTDQKRNAAAFKAAYLALVGGNGADVNQTALAYEAIRAVTAQINECHTAFLDPEQYRSVNAGLSGTNTYGGIGVTIRTQTRPVTIGGIFPDSPAAKSGLRPGDAIIAVDGTDVSDLAADSISPLVRGKEGTPVRLTVTREGAAAPLVFTIIRAQIQVPVFISQLQSGPNGEKIGYMKLYSFSTDADQQVQQALEDFERQGVVAWVLDLRDNGGGYIDVLSRIASRFVKNGDPVAYRIVRDGSAETINTDKALAFNPQRPLAVLINGGSASASEALASAAFDEGFGRLFGQTTSGCLAGASNYKLADGSAVQITIWKIVSPQRREINRVGQQPNEEIAPDPTGKTDPVLDGAVKWLVTQLKR